MTSQIKPKPQKFKGASSGGDDPSPKKTREKKPPKKITADYLHNAGLYYLQRFAASTGRFQRVMTRKIDRSCHYHSDQDREACLAMLDKLVVRFVESGLLNDDIYARGLALSLRRRGYSTRMISSKMGERGVGSDAIAQALAELNEGEQNHDPDLEAGLRLARRRRIGPYGPAGAEIENKHIAAFARAGFSYEMTQKILAMPRADADSILL